MRIEQLAIVACLLVLLAACRRESDVMTLAGRLARDASYRRQSLQSSLVNQPNDNMGCLSALPVRQPRP
jgi:hypothetical protein